MSFVHWTLQCKSLSSASPALMLVFPFALVECCYMCLVQCSTKPHALLTFSAALPCRPLDGQISMLISTDRPQVSSCLQLPGELIEANAAGVCVERRLVSCGHGVLLQQAVADCHSVDCQGCLRPAGGNVQRSRTAAAGASLCCRACCKQAAAPGDVEGCTSQPPRHRRMVWRPPA